MSSPIQQESDPYSSEPDPETPENNESTSTDSESNIDRNQHRVILKMLNLCKDIAVLMLIAVVYAELTNERPPKVSRSPAAYPFFPSTSPVNDWYRGQIGRAIDEARSSDIAFAMFYAPWDAESQNARKAFDRVAHWMRDRVAFTAVNCWQPGSECRRRYSKVYKWPVLIGYPTHGRGVQYNGPIEAAHMVKFLENMCRPILRVGSVTELLGKYDVVVCANINLSPGSYEYAVFYATALRFLERDPFRDIAFAVLPQYNLSRIQIFSWNGTETYEGEWLPDPLTDWILKYSHQILRWLTPSGAKSLNLGSFIQPGPTLILFTPRNPLAEDNDVFNMVREIAYEYHDRGNAYLTKRCKLVTREREKNAQHNIRLQEKCSKKKSFLLANVWTNTSLKDCHCDKLIYSGDPDTCFSYLLDEKYALRVLESHESKAGVSLKGLANAANFTLSFGIFDSLRFYHFAERLGLEDTGAVIVDDKKENHYIMSGEVTSHNLRHFIYNYTHKMLMRSLRSRNRITSASATVSHVDSCSKGHFCVKELTSDTFLSSVMEKHKVVLVSYYSKQCAFCSGIAYAFLTVAKKLATVQDIVFTRIDGDVNLLPWEYTMESYPTILFFPALRKAESRAFPKNLPLTVPNLLGFILTNLEPVLKLKTIWSLCQQSMFLDEKSSCLTSLRLETLMMIGRSLKEWRLSSRRHKVLYMLQTLRNLHLLFAHSPDDTSKIENYFKRLRG